MSRFKDPCPSCYGLKDREARTCRWCSYPTFDPAHIDRDWWLAFTGLFMGEGYVGIVVRDGKYFSPKATLRQRADNRPLIQDIADRLGGGVTEHYGSVNPHLEWVLTGSRRVYNFCELLYLCPLPAKKLEEAQMVQDFIEWRRHLPHIWSEENRQEALRRAEAIKSFRAY